MIPLNLADLLLQALSKTWATLLTNWPLLLISALVAAYLKLYLDQRRVGEFLKRNQGAGVFGATLVAVTTPLCSCGTTAVILGMMANLLSWAPIVAFMVASPLTSPAQFFYSAGLFGWSFAAAFFLASIVLGLLGGLVAYLAEKRGWLENQTRFRPITGGSLDTLEAVQTGSAAGSKATASDFARESGRIGGQLLLFFFGFAFIGYVLNGLIPTAWVSSLFGSGQTYGVALAATLGLPLYINTEASMPLVRSFIEMGMSPGAALAFLITGAGTSIGAITGALTIARWRVVGLVIGVLWVGAILFGYLYNLIF